VKWLVVVFVAVVLVIVAVLIIGWTLPQQHEVSRSADLPQPADVVWRAITDVGAFPSWRTGVTAIEQLPGAPGHENWRETGKNGRITYEVVESEPPRRLVTKIADRSLPFGGSWTYELSPVDGGTRLTITERGEVYNPVYRFVSRYVMGHTATIDRYLSDLGKKLGS
jgi:uncharacterized protein YndB with AHSA1/START domain